VSADVRTFLRRISFIPDRTGFDLVRKRVVRFSGARANREIHKNQRKKKTGSDSKNPSRQAVPPREIVTRLLEFHGQRTPLLESPPYEGPALAADIQLLLQFIVPAFAPLDPVQCMVDMSGIPTFGTPMVDASGLSTSVPTP
jgi:hypothetical protein